MKRCPKCKIEKSKSEFSKRSRNRDGLRYQCKNCDWLYNQSERSKETKRKYNKKSWLDHPEKRKARHAVSNAIRDGRLERPLSCESCFQEKFVHGHHPDYDKHLDVYWVCSECHIELHKELILV